MIVKMMVNNHFAEDGADDGDNDDDRTGNDPDGR